MTDEKASERTASALMAQSVEASLTTDDLHRSRAWYTEVLGFTVDREHEREGKLIAVSLRAGSVRLLITQENGARGAERRKGEGFSLQLTTAQDIDAIAARVTQAGAELDTPPSSAFGARFFRLRDPDGFRWVVSSPRAR